MNATTTPATELRFFSAYSDLEPQIRDLTHMAELSRRNRRRKTRARGSTVRGCARRANGLRPRESLRGRLSGRPFVLSDGIMRHWRWRA
jgi:hypothetical protein